MSYKELGIIIESLEGQYYIMQKHPKRKDWAIEVAWHLNGLLTDFRSWSLSKNLVQGPEYMVLWSQVNTKHSDDLKKLVGKLEKEQKGVER